MNQSERDSQKIYKNTRKGGSFFFTFYETGSQRNECATYKILERIRKILKNRKMVSVIFASSLTQEEKKVHRRWFPS